MFYQIIYMSASIKVKLERIETEIAVLTSEDNKEFIWPVAKLPAGAAIGSVFYISLTPEPEDEEETRRVAKVMLEEILNGSEKEEGLK